MILTAPPKVLSSGIAGMIDGRAEHCPDVERARALAASVRLDGLSDGDLDDMERVALGMVVSLRHERMRRAGWKITEWRRRGAPIDLDRHYGGVVDHPYSIILKDGTVAWVVEPYEAGPGELADLKGRLEPGEWKITVRPDWSLHFPANTTAVWIMRREG